MVSTDTWVWWYQSNHSEADLNASRIRQLYHAMKVWHYAPGTTVGVCSYVLAVYGIRIRYAMSGANMEDW
eukprot:2104621-Rhodomonas_salina.2